MVEQSGVRVPVSKSLQFVGLGEVLFDVFEDGAATLGGAPLNVAVHAHQLASVLGRGEGVVVSRIGEDAWGSEIRRAISARGMSAEYLQTDPAHSTGIVSVFMKDGEPGYQIERGAAWDFIEDNASLRDLAANCDAVCFGSLAQRSSPSRETVQAFVKAAANAVRLYDVNLRRNTLTHEPGYSAEIIETSCGMATMVKVNAAELLEMADMFGVESTNAAGDDALPDLVERVMKRLAIRTLILTRGEKGTALYTGGRSYEGRLPLVTLREVHPVGAGDACTAAILFGSVLGLPPDDAVDLGNTMGAWVASNRSATPELSHEISEYIMRTVGDRGAGERGSVGKTI